MSKSKDFPVIVHPLCECGGQTVYFGEALMGSLRCDNCEQCLIGVGDNFIATIDERWMRGDRGYQGHIADTDNN